MANPYVLRYANPFKTETVIVPTASTGSGINNYDTSLSLVGPGYPNYGYAYAQNFLNLLENFSGPYAPENSIEGQLWYDTSIADKKVLRINNGTDTSSRWPAVSGIYQQTDDPFVQYRETIKEGDLWVDTGNGQVKIRTGIEWKTVGPVISSGIDKTGSEATTASSTSDVIYPIIKNWVNGKVVEIISYNAFTPKQVIDGFTNILTGTNLTTKVNAKYNGVATKADGIVVSGNTVLRAYEILRNRASLQIHTGTFVVNSADGLFVKNATYNHSIQLNSDINGAKLFFNDDNKNFKVGIENWSYITFDPVTSGGIVAVNTLTNTGVGPEVSLNVFGGAQISNTLTITLNANNALVVAGGAKISGFTKVENNFWVTGVTTASGRVIIGSSIGSGLILDPAKDEVYDIGSNTRKFRRVYAKEFGSTASQFYGTLNGPSTRLASNRNFGLGGQLTATSVAFNGSQDVVIQAALKRNAIDSQPTTSTVTATQTLLVLNTASNLNELEKISREDFLRDIISALIPTGAIIPWSTSTTSTLYNNFLICNGAIYSRTGTYSNLFNTIGTQYTSSTVAASDFQVPNYILPLTTGTLYFIIKT